MQRYLFCYREHGLLHAQPHTITGTVLLSSSWSHHRFSPALVCRLLTHDIVKRFEGQTV